MSADDSRHDSTGVDPRQGDLLELLAATETEDQQYRDARRRRLREAGHGKPADSDAARQGRGR